MKRTWPTWFTVVAAVGLIIAVVAIYIAYQKYTVQICYADQDNGCDSPGSFVQCGVVLFRTVCNPTGATLSYYLYLGIGIGGAVVAMAAAIEDYRNRKRC
jgi:hypothetical protein